jgi:hypothetical protein
MYHKTPFLENPHSSKLKKKKKKKEKEKEEDKFLRLLLGVILL